MDKTPPAENDQSPEDILKEFLGKDDPEGTKALKEVMGDDFNKLIGQLSELKSLMSQLENIQDLGVDNIGKVRPNFKPDPKDFPDEKIEGVDEEEEEK